MFRCVAVAALIMAALADRADAIEMFTNFNNGQNVGFPPMEVPISAYRGFGRGGWNPYAEGMPLRTNPPVPAMLPTGQARSAGGYHYGSAIPNDYPAYYAGARRRNRLQSGNTYSPTINARPTESEYRSNDAAGDVVESSSNQPSLAPGVSVMVPSTLQAAKAQFEETETSSRVNRPITVLHAQPGSSPELEPTQAAESTHPVQSDEDLTDESKTDSQ